MKRIAPGEAHWAARLTEDHVREAWRLHLDDCLEPVQIAAVMGVHKATIARIFAGDAWVNCRPTLPADYGTPAWRFWRNVDRRDQESCWPWKGSARPADYGRVIWDGKQQPAHRVAYLLSGHAIPDGWVVDHLCRQPWCVNPAHLEAVTNRENTLRGSGPAAVNARKTHCVNGHELTTDNTLIARDGSRRCRQCALSKARRRYQERQQHV